MVEIKINVNVTVICSEETARREGFQSLEQRLEAEKIREDLIAWLDNPANADDECYSDVFKDVYGFRPRW